ERRQHWRAAVEEDRGEARETAGEGVAADRADQRESQRDAGDGATSGLRAEIRGGAQREAGECDRQERPDRPERARHREEGGRRSRHGRTRSLQQLYEAGQHEEEEHDDRDAADHRQQQRVDHGGGDAGPELVLALELVGQATERAVEITAALAGADEAYVNRWERAAMSGERGREVVASLDVGAHAPQRGADVATYHARSGIEGAGERQPGREEGRLGAAALAAAGHVHRLVAEHGHRWPLCLLPALHIRVLARSARLAVGPVAEQVEAGAALHSRTPV